MHQNSGGGRALDYGRLIWGAVLLWRPAPVIRTAGHPATATATTVARTLGARHVAQALLLIGADRTTLLGLPPTRRVVRRLAAAADALHALSAVALALAGFATRAWTADAAAASAFAATTWRSADATRSEQTT